MTQLFIILAQSVTGAVITIIALLLVAAVIGYLTAWFYAKSVYTPIIKDLENEKADLKKQVSGLKDDINKLNEKIEKLNETIKKQEEKIQGQEEKIKKQDEKIVKLEGEIAEKIQEIGNLTKSEK